MQKNKLETIKARFESAEKALSEKQTLKRLKDNSTLKKLALAIEEYAMYDTYEACVKIYHLFRIRTWRSQDIESVTWIKRRLRSIKAGIHKTHPVQMELFATPS